MGSAWRIVKEKHSSGAFTGEGAEKNGGRWNLPGTPVVYASSTLALATLEIVVHLEPPYISRYLAYRIEFEDGMVSTAGDLPVDWNSDALSEEAQKLGTRWLRSLAGVVLAVPSVIVPQEFNYLLNPKHPDFSRIKITAPQLFVLDKRLVE